MNADQRNILYFSSFGNLRWGGQRSLFHLVTRLDKPSFRPHVVLPTDEDMARQLRLRGVEVIVLDLPKIWGLNVFDTLGAFRSVLQVIDQHRIDLIHTDGTRNTLYAGLAARLRNLPLVWHIRSSERDRLDPILRLLATKIILVADALRKRFAAPAGDDRFVTIYNGVDLASFNGSSVPSHVRKDFAIPDGGFLASCLGRIEKRKGQLVLIEACGQLKAQGSPVRLFFAGETAEPDYYRACVDAVRRYGIQDSTIFAGHLDDPVSLLRESDVMVLPSLSGEAFSRSIIEAMAVGLPVIASDVGGAPEAVQNGVSGWIVPPGDVLTLRETILRLQQDPVLRRQMGEAALERVQERFRIEENVRKTESLYRKLLGIPS